MASRLRPVSATETLANSTATTIMITAAPTEAAISLCNRSIAAPTKRQPMPAPTTTCAAATSSPGGRDAVKPPRWTPALKIIGPIMKAAGNRSSLPTVAPAKPQPMSTA